MNENSLSFAPGISEGSNDSLTSAISSDGIPSLGKWYKVPARCGVAVRLKKGNTLELRNDSGSQVCDFWAFKEDNLHESLSMEHCRTHLGRNSIREQDELVTNWRRPVLKVLSDTSPGVHDMLIASCDLNRYKGLGVDGYHDNCTDNLRMALAAIGETATHLPSPLNLWMNVGVGEDGAIEFLAPISKAGDVIEFEALDDLIVAMSACPQDITPVNGDDRAIYDLNFRVR